MRKPQNMLVECDHKSGLKYINIAYYIYYTPTVGNYHNIFFTFDFVTLDHRKKTRTTSTKRILCKDYIYYTLIAACLSGHSTI